MFSDGGRAYISDVVVIEVQVRQRREVLRDGDRARIADVVLRDA